MVDKNISSINKRKQNNEKFSNIDSKINILKKGIKELQEIFYSIYKENELSNNNKLIFIKRGIDKLNSASRYILSLRLEKKEDPIELDKEIKDLYTKICKDISILDDKIFKLYNLENFNKTNNYVGSLKSNLDNLRLGSDCLKRLDINEIVDTKKD